MRPGRLLALATIVLALGGYIYFVERHGPTTDELNQRRDKLFPELDPAKVQKILVSNSKGRFELEKRDGSWILLSPIADDANDGAVSGLLSALAGLKAVRTLEAKDVKLGDLGLESTALSVALTDDKGQQSTMSVGAEMPLGGNRAARTTGEQVYVVPSAIVTDLEKDVAAWRSSYLARVSAIDVASVVIRDATGKVALARSGDVWHVTEPVADLAEHGRTDALIADIAAAQIQELVDTPGDLRPLGLDPPQLAITFVSKDGKPKVDLACGIERLKDGAAQRICRRRGERVSWVNTSATAKATAAGDDWRSKKLVSLEPWNASKLEITKGDTAVTLERKDGIWRSSGTEVDGEAVSRRLGTLADLTVSAYDQPKPAGTGTGRITVTAEDSGVVDATFFLASGSGPSTAVVLGRPGPLSVDSGKVRELLADPSSLAKPKPPPPAPGAAPSESKAPAAAPGGAPKND